MSTISADDDRTTPLATMSVHTGILEAQRDIIRCAKALCQADHRMSVTATDPSTNARQRTDACLDRDDKEELLLAAAARLLWLEEQAVL